MWSEFLQWHQDLADELVVVDTGSNDDSRQQALDAGAVLVDHPWGDDFSAARNAGLAVASGSWILILDVDERISPRDRATLRQALHGSVDRVYLQETINYLDDPGHLEWRPVSGRYAMEEQGQTGYFSARRIGLFPREPRLRFSGRIHETVLPAAQALRWPSVDLAVPVHHYGYTLSPEVNRARRDRYRHLAEHKVRENPQDWSGLLELATAYLEDRDIQQAISMLERVVCGPSGLRPVVRGHFLLGRVRREQGHAAAAGELLGEAVNQDPTFLFGWLELIRCRADAARWTDVARLLNQAASHFGLQEPLLVREELRYLIKTGQLPRALERANWLLETCPRWQEIDNLRQRLEILVERHGSA